MAQSCRAGMARLTDLEEKAEEVEAELVSQQHMEDKVNKVNTLISDRLQNATRSVLVSSISSRKNCKGRQDPHPRRAPDTR